MLENKYLKDMPPHDKELERVLLGTFILQPKYINTASVDLFYTIAHQQIFSKMLELRQKRIQISEPLLVHHLPHITLTEIVSLTDGAYKLSGKQINAIIKQLKVLKIKRRLKIFTYQVYDAIDKGQDLDEVNKVMEELKKEELKSGDSLGATIEEMMKHFEEYIAKGEGIKLGIPALDRMMRGLGEGEVLYIEGRAKVAKSALVQNALRYFAINYPQYGALFFSFEMPPAQVTERTIMIELNKSPEEVKFLAPEKREQVVKQYKNIFYITRILNLADIQKHIIEYKFKSDIKLVVIDYLTKIKTKIEGEYEFLRLATKAIKEMAKELEVGVIVIAQTGREEGGYGWKPLNLQSGRGSGTIEEDADFVLGIYRPELNPDLTEMQKLKWRNVAILQVLGSRRTGSGQKIELYFNKKSLRIYELAREEENAKLEN